MQTEKFFQVMDDGTEVSVNRWLPDDERTAKAVIVLSHGMQEHALRYDRIGSIFAEKGYIFNAHDHRGHGKTASSAKAKSKGDFGVLAEKDGFERVTQDLKLVIEEIKRDYPDKKIILLGHSFGSFVAQNYIENNEGRISGCILCGSSGPQGSKVKWGNRFIKFLMLFRKYNSPSAFVQNLCFGHYMDRIKNPETPNDWLSANKENVRMYMNDQWCGGVFSISFFRDLTDGLLKIHNPKNMKKISKKLPIFIISGTEDPVGNYGKSVSELCLDYMENGIEICDMKLYGGDRHEIMNEDDSPTVLSDIDSWIEGKVLK